MTEIKRLEDLTPELVTMMLNADEKPFAFSDYMSQLYSLGLAFETIDHKILFTERGAALVADYRKRQVYGDMTPAEIAEYDASQDSLYEAHERHQQEMKDAASDMVTAYPTTDGRKWGELNRDDQWLEFIFMHETVKHLRADIVALKAENARQWEALKTIRDTLAELSDNDIPWLDEERGIYHIVDNALQPRFDACPRCNGDGYTSVRNGDDDTPCPECSVDSGDVPF